ncbi:hypothetical protein R3P38DRAFT_2772305 [Favolaschia claudopus]|uniref:Uncharacterized protein n=1 Tax=Favolaschia claudopus TaxID=2862362 RepID=A0AAW0C581_9AGAR
MPPHSRGAPHLTDIPESVARPQFMRHSVAIAGRHRHESEFESVAFGGSPSSNATMIEVAAVRPPRALLLELCMLRCGMLGLVLRFTQTTISILGVLVLTVAIQNSTCLSSDSRAFYVSALLAAQKRPLDKRFKSHGDTEPRPEGVGELKRANTIGSGLPRSPQDRVREGERRRKTTKGGEGKGKERKVWNLGIYK